ncbi:DEAD/DEAH box helicase [Brevibacillus laterosporus]|uniref:Helicase SNF n=1 Tax=Brevibacillus laterosporus TaxID=1465 RepID=A0AAP8Q9Y5_BRELA|nr:DEAD/DEAH box helicase [Brevibacillus laterosporus]PPA90305.1 helicase SNF [Brevibacillus laterosporus]
MSFQLSRRIIKTLCGQISYDKGDVYYQTGKVMITHYDPNQQSYEATVNGSNGYQVTITLEQRGGVNAECTCPKLSSYDKFCQHIAAVLLSIRDSDQDSSTVPRSVNTQVHDRAKFAGSTDRPAPFLDQNQMANHMLKMFSHKSLRPSSTRAFLDTRDVLDVEFICRPFHYGYGKYMFGLELKLGPKRLYVVKNIREFLGRMDRREGVLFSKHFAYDPEHHSFQKENDEVLRQLIQISQNEKMYRDTWNNFVHANSKSGDRMLLIPPFSWEPLLALLMKAPLVKLGQGERLFDGIHLSDEPLPLQFEFDQAQSEGYQLDIQGLDKLTVMESYGVVLSEGKLIKLQHEHCKRLIELKNLLETSHQNQVQIKKEQMEPFMEKVIPGLIKLGSVHIAQAVSEQIVQTPLRARLYLDRVRDRLLAGLEFQYGDIVINPLEGTSRKKDTDPILMRDGDQERRILELMEKSSFVMTEAGYFMDDEEAEYEFLYHVVPQLEKLLKVYATTAVKVRLHTGHTPPKVSVDVDDRMQWLEFNFDMAGIPDSDVRKLLKSLEEKRKYYRLPNGALLPLESVEFQEISNFMDEIGIRMEEWKEANLRLPLVRGLHLIDSQERGKNVKLGKSFRRLIENIRNPDNLDFPVPDSLAHVLRDYQVYGFQWMKTLAHYHFGGILADDMGLGKTVQSIAFIASVLPDIREQGMPALIVCPASLVYNWRNELKRFAPEIRTVIADGSRMERSSIIRDASKVDVIITSYPLLRRDIDLYVVPMFYTLILDEAQAFKNYVTQTAQAVKEIQAKYRFALTGTPVENKLEELWSIFDAVFPELFQNRKAFHNVTQEMVAKRIRPFLLRRLKTDVLKELPEKIESIQASTLLPDQKKLYVAYLAKLQQETLKHLDEDGFQKNKIKILAGLTRLRQLCCHPGLFVEGYSGSSAKFEQLLEIVQECLSAGKRLLVFSQFTQMLGFIGRELGYLGVPYFYLDGNTPTAERVELCSRFNEGERDLFLLSLKAGGTGLNLTGADTVILYDLWWNPAVEQQAADRAHRIGQKNVVQVVRLVTQGTVEEKMYELQQKKKNLIDEVIQPGHEALSTLTEQEIREILMI